jgi:hypothetical protein
VQAFSFSIIGVGLFALNCFVFGGRDNNNIGLINMMKGGEENCNLLGRSAVRLGRFFVLISPFGQVTSWH